MKKIQLLANIARRIEETNTAINTNATYATRLYPLLNTLWEEVDNLCYELYGLTETEKETIMSNPRSDHYYE